MRIISALGKACNKYRGSNQVSKLVLKLEADEFKWKPEASTELWTVMQLDRQTIEQRSQYTPRQNPDSRGLYF